MRRQAACLQADDVGGVKLRERLSPAGEVAGAEDLEIVRGGVAGEAEVLPALAEDFVAHRVGDAVRPESAGGEVVAVVDKPPNRLCDGHDLIDEPARLLRERGAGFVRVWRCKERRSRVHERLVNRLVKWLNPSGRLADERGCVTPSLVASLAAVLLHECPEARVFADRVEVTVFFHESEVAIAEFDRLARLPKARSGCFRSA